MTQPTRDTETPDPRLNAALQGYLERIDQGESVDVEAFLAQHADIAEPLRSFIAASEDLARRAATPEMSTNRTVRGTLHDAAPHVPGEAPALPEVFGRYRVQRVLGRGAMGAVYLADDTQLGRQVALKIPMFQGDGAAEQLERFYREARSAATLRSPHICPVYDVGDIDGQHYLSMAYIAGHPLSELIKAKGRQPERQVLLLLRKLALAIQEAHDRGIVHRDLKPGNVMIDAKSEPIIMDFGLAVQLQTEAAARLTQSGVIVGSPAYMSPEQVDGDPAKISPATDQYALGVMLYELLTGELPFRGTITAVINQIVSKSPPSPRQLRPDLDPRVEALCLKMMAKSPEERFPSMQAVAEQMLAILKEPASSGEAAVQKTLKSGDALSTKAVEQQKQVQQFIKQGELPAALEALKPLMSGKNAKLAEWAQQQQTFLTGEIARWESELPTLCNLAKTLLAKHDYAEARKVLTAAPQGIRTQAAHDLLAEAADKDDECGLLLTDIEQAIRKEFPTELPGLVKRFLQLKPRHKAILALAADLKQYGPERAIHLRRGQQKFLDPAGRTVQPLHVALAIGGLLTLMAAVYLAVITFQTPHGTVVIEVHDPGITAKFAQDEVTLSSGTEKFKLKTTEKRTLQLEVNGLVVESATQEITVAKNETKLVTVRLKDGKPEVSINDTPAVFAVPDKQVANAQDGEKPAEGEWVSLFNGQDLTGWKQFPAGPDHWSVVDGVLTGNSNRVSSFLISDRDDYRNFRLTAEVQFENTNAGIMLRATETEHDVRGYEAEIISATRGAGGTGNLMFPGAAQRVPLQVATGPFPKPDTWFTYTVECLDQDITISLDGRTALQYREETEQFPRGHIMLQSYIGPIRFRDIKLLELPSGSGATTPDGWIDLLADAVPEVHSNKATPFRREGSRLLISPTDPTSKTWGGLFPPREIAGDYDLEVDFLAVGCQSLHIGLPLNETIVTLLYGDLGSVLKWIDGKDVVVEDIKPPHGNPANKLQSGVVHRLQASVRHQGENVTVDTQVDGVSSGRFTGLRSRLSTPKTTDPMPNHLKLSTFFHNLANDRRLEVHKARVRMVKAAVPASPALPSPPVSTSPTVAANKVLLDVDFRTSHGDFSRGDWHHVLNEHKDGEFRYLGKKVAWWWSGLHPVFWDTEYSFIRDFTLELDVRIVSQKKGRFVVEFGRGDGGRCWISMDEAGRIGLHHGVYGDVVPPLRAPSMKSVSEFNALRVSVQNKVVQASVNGNLLFEKKLDRYGPASMTLWLNPDEVPFDVRIRRIRLEVPNAPPPRFDREVRRLKGHTDIIRGIAFLPDNQRAVSVGHAKEFKLWGVTTGTLLFDFPKDGPSHTANVTSVSVSGDGRRALTGCDDGHVRLWDLDNRTLLRTLKGHTEPVVAVQLSKDGLVGLSSSHDDTIRRWDLKPGGRSRVVATGAVDGYVAVSPDGTVVASGHTAGAVVLRSPNNTAALPADGPDHVVGLAFTPDGSQLVTGAGDGTVRVWDLATGKQVHRFEADDIGFNSIAITHDGAYALAGGRDQTIRGWNLKTGDPAFVLRADSPVTHRLALSSNNEYLLTGGGDRDWKKAGDYDLRLWKVPSPPAPPKPLDESKLTLQFDADFSKGLNGFGGVEDEFFKVGLIDGEWQHMGKKAGWGGWGGPQPPLRQQSHDNFVFEAEARWANSKEYGWGLDFGHLPNQQHHRLHVGIDRKIWLAYWQQGDQWKDTLPPTLVPSMRAPTEHNTIRLEVVRGVARVFVNSQFVGEAKLPKYNASMLATVLYPRDGQPDIRFRRMRLWHVKE